MSKAPRMVRSHFQFLAEMLQKVIIHNNMTEEQADWLISSFSVELAKTNPAFKADLFAQVAKSVP